MADTLSDIQAQKLPAKVGFTGSVPDMLRAYYRINAEAPVAAIPNLSSADYERSMYMNFTGVDPAAHSISDLERRFYTVVSAGDDTMPLSSREYEYWSELI